MRPVSEQHLSDELARAGALAPVTPEVLNSLDNLVGVMESPEVRAQLGEPRRHRRRGWLIVVPAVLVLVGIPAGAIALNSWTARTGQFGGSGTEIVDRSEWIGLDAPDAPDVIAELYDPALPLPSGATPSDVLNPVAAMFAKMGTVPAGESGHVLAQETAIQGSFERAARCLWYREWLDADSHSDSARRDAATRGIQDSISWPITVATDGGGVVELLQVGADAAADGDQSGVRGAYGNCSNLYGPVAK